MVEPDSIEEVDQYLGGISSFEYIQDGVNESYIVRGGDGETYFLKLGTNPNSRLETEIWVINELQDEVPVPNIYLSGETAKGNRYFLSEYIDADQGQYPTKIESGRTLFTKVGQQLAYLHEASEEVEFGILPPRQNKNYTRWEDFYREWIRYTCEDAKKNYPSVSSQLVRLIHWCDIPEPDSHVINPIDFHTRNIFHRDNQIEYLIDLERCFGGHPGWSYATTGELLSHSPVENAKQSFRKGYKSVRQPPNLDPCYKIAGLARSMRAAHMIWSDESEHQEEFEEKANRIEELID